MSVMPLFALKPHCLLGTFSLAMIGTSTLSRILARTFPLMDKRVILREFEQPS